MAADHSLGVTFCGSATIGICFWRVELEILLSQKVVTFTKIFFLFEMVIIADVFELA